MKLSSFELRPRQLPILCTYKPSECRGFQSRRLGKEGVERQMAEAVYAQNIVHSASHNFFQLSNERFMNAHYVIHPLVLGAQS